MTARDWVISKLLKDEAGRIGQPVGTISVDADHGFTVHRPSLPDAHVYCPEGHNVLTTMDVDQAVENFPSTQFIIFLRRATANDIFQYAKERGIAVGRLGELQSALQNSPDISQFVSRERTYVSQRLTNNRAVQSWERVGENAYRIERTAMSPSTIVIATFDQYEATSDRIYTILEQYADLDLNVIVATNPSTKGFAAPASEAARHANVKLVTMSELQVELVRSWD